MIVTPKIDGRAFRKLVEEVRRIAPHYVPEWKAEDERDPGLALLQVFALIVENVTARLDRAPAKHFVAFLDSLGISRLPALPSEALVTFKLTPAANGTLDSNVLIQAGARVIAPATGGRDEDLPFETVSKLLAVPDISPKEAFLQAAYGVDPSQDAIFAPPPKFLEQAPRTPSALSYQVQAFADENSKLLQLNHAIGLEEGSYLRIGEDNPIKAIVVKVEESLVHVEQELKRNVQVLEPVAPILDFEVFNGIDKQEHVLYIGHSELFNIKQRAQITLIVTLGSGPPLTPLSIDWQYWTETEEEGGLWRDLDVVDKTLGLSSAGEVILLKTAEEEIKEKEIHGKKSRWIRAKLAEKLPFGDGRAVPQIDRIEMKVSSGGKEDPLIVRPCAPFLVECEPEEPASPGETPESECLTNGIPADQLFHNADPLDPQLDFFPFGAEPRQFDQFYIASQEAFSKKGAKITLAMQVAMEMLAAPALAVSSGGLHVYSIGSHRRLYALNLNNDQWDTPVDPSRESVPGQPAGSSEYLLRSNSSPAAVSSDDGTTQYVFVRSANKQAETEHAIWERFYRDNDRPQWVYLGTPQASGQKLQLPFDPAAVRLLNGNVQVFLVASDGALYAKKLRGDSGREIAAAWENHGVPNNVRLNSTPSAVHAESGDFLIFVTGDDGKVYQLRTGEKKWEPLEPQPFIAKSRPFAVPFLDQSGQTCAKVFVLDDQGNLHECQTQAPGSDQGNIWINLEKPHDVDNKDFSDPTGFLEDAAADFDKEGKHIFVNFSEQGGVTLYERVDGDGTDTWKLRESPGDPELRDSPAAAFDNKSRSFVVVSATKRNSLLMYRPLEETGNLVAGNDRAAFLQDLPPGEYVGKELHVYEGPAADQRQKIEAVDQGRSLVLLESEWNTIPDQDSKCRILESLETNYTTPSAVDSRNRIRLDPNDRDTVARASVIERLDVGERRKVIRITTSRKGTRTAIVESEWSSPPTEGVSYRVLKTLYEGTAGGHADRTAVLFDPGQSSVSLTGIQLSVDNAVTRHQVIKFISLATGIAFLGEDWTSTPVPNAQYLMLLDSYASTEYVAPGSEDVNPELSWEYWNGRGWLGLNVDQDATRNLLKSGEIVFELKKDIVIEPTEVAGQKNHWVRARLIGGDYGKEIFRVKTDNNNNTQEIIRDRSGLNPPKIEKLRICYEMVEGKPPELCLTFNNLDHLDQTSACNTPGAFFQPFVRLPDESKSLYLGFGRTFKGGPVGLLLDAAEVSIEESNPPKLGWKFRKDRKWNDLTVKDDSRALTRRGILTVSPSAALTNETFFGKPLFWIRGALSEGSGYRQPPLLRGIFPNTVRAIQAETVTGEIVGSSSGEPNQRFQLQKAPVHQGEEIRVREVLSHEDKNELTEKDKEAFVEPVDIPGTWVRWREVADFVECKKDDRCYLIDRASGELRFGDDRRGKVPPADVDNIRAFRYQAGGGKKGNILPGEIKNLATAIAGVESAFNPVEAGGGADTAPSSTVPEEKFVAELMEIGPPRFRHRGRAVTPEDFEALAREFSREIAKVRCLPATRVEARGDASLGPCDENLTHRRLARHGWVSLLVVPRSNERRPCPSLELRRVLGRRLMERAPAQLSAGEQIVIAPPDYITISVEIDVYARSIEDASEAEGLVRQELERFLHPVNGGPEDSGWDFGRAVQASDVYAQLEQIETVDRVQNLKFFYQGKESSETVTIPPNSLPASGEHEIRIFIGGEA